MDAEQEERTERQKAWENFIRSVWAVDFVTYYEAFLAGWEAGRNYKPQPKVNGWELDEEYAEYGKRKHGYECADCGHLVSSHTYPDTNGCVIIGCSCENRF